MIYYCEELKRKARAKLNKRYSAPMGAFMTMVMIITLIQDIFDKATGNVANLTDNIITYAMEFLLALIAVVMNAGILSIHLKLARGEKVRITEVFRFFKENPDRFLMAGFVITVIEAIGSAGIIGGLNVIYRMQTISEMLGGIEAVSVAALGVVLIVLGLVILMIANIEFALTYFYIIDNPDRDWATSLVVSVRLMRGHRFRLFCLYLTFIGMAILSVLSMGIGFLWTIPYMNQTACMFYRDIIGEDCVM